jgi:hypothetical protein
MIDYLNLGEMIERLQLCGFVKEGEHNHSAPCQWEIDGQMLIVREWYHWAGALDCRMATFHCNHGRQYLLVFGATTRTSPKVIPFIKRFNEQQLRLLMADLDPEVVDVMRLCS